MNLNDYLKEIEMRTERQKWYHDVYLNCEHWKERRKRAIRIAENKCQICGREGSDKCVINIHHNCYDNIGNEKDRDLIAICRNCHAVVHDKLPKFDVSEELENLYKNIIF